MIRNIKIKNILDIFQIKKSMEPNKGNQFLKYENLFLTCLALNPYYKLELNSNLVFAFKSMVR
jgi:hypothetical protein